MYKTSLVCKTDSYADKNKSCSVPLTPLVRCIVPLQETPGRNLSFSIPTISSNDVFMSCHTVWGVFLYKCSFCHLFRKKNRQTLCAGSISYLYVAGLLHKPSRVLCCSVTFRKLDSEELESPFKVGLQEVFFGCLEGDMKGWEERIKHEDV